jgi:hypothetical protein
MSFDVDLPCEDKEYNEMVIAQICPRTNFIIAKLDYEAYSADKDDIGRVS